MHLQFLLSIHRNVEVVYSVQMCPAWCIAKLRIVPYNSYAIVCIAITTYVRSYIRT